MYCLWYMGFFFTCYLSFTVHIQGVLDVLKLHESTSDVLLVHVGSGNQEECKFMHMKQRNVTKTKIDITKCELYDQVKQLIEKRKAKTLIVRAQLLIQQIANI